MTNKNLNRNSPTRDLLRFAKEHGYHDNEGMDNSPSWMSQELDERALKTIDEINKLREHINFCCVQAQKCIGSSDFNIWEDRRKEAETEIRQLLQKQQQLDKK